MASFKQVLRTTLADLGLLKASLYIWQGAPFSVLALRELVGCTLNGLKIRRFDRNVIRESGLLDNGYICYPTAPAEVIDAARHFKAGENIGIDEVTLPILIYLLNLVRDDVVAYLGTNARIDNICVTVVPASTETSKSVSGSWHTDNVGHRLKLFFCIEGYGDVPTCYRPGTNRKRTAPGN